MSTTSSGTDLNTKYQKLAAEYAKLRSQVPVLKKAVIDEQTKNTELNEELKEKEQTVRKVNGEIESLTFRNQQLTKRVESLQQSVEELSTNQKNNQKQPHSKKIPKSTSEQVVSSLGPSSNGGHGVLEEELQRKLKENEHLHKQVYEMRLAHEVETQKLLVRIKSLEADSSVIRSDLSVIRNQHDIMVDELKSEKERLHKSLNFVQTKLNDSAGELEKYRKFCDSMEETDDSAIVTDASSALLSHVNNDEVNGDLLSLTSMSNILEPSLSPAVPPSTEVSPLRCDLNLSEATRTSLDVPLVDMSSVESYAKFLLLIRPHLSDLVNHLTNYHSYCEQRCKLYPCDSNLEELSATSINYGALLRDKSYVCRSISTAFDTLCDKIGDNYAQHINLHNDITFVIDHFSSYVKFLNELLPLFKKSIEEECLISWCNQRLERENRCYEQLFENFVVVLSQFHTELLRFFGASQEDCSKYLNSLPFYFQEVSKASHELTVEYSLKIAEEHQLPVTTKKLKSTNECVYSSLNSIQSSWKSIANVFESHKSVMESYVKERLKIDTFHVEMLNKHKEYSQTFAKLSQSESSVHADMKSSSSIQSLQSCILVSSNEIVEEYQTKLKEKQQLVAELEREKEHWAFETELLKMKIKQQSKSAGETDEQCSNNNNADSGLNLVKEYFEDKLLEMNIRLQNEEGKIVLYQKECQNLINIVQVLHRQKDNLQVELRQSSTERNSLKDELETVRQGYEGQMKMLSEHLAQMNHKLTKQTDEIEMLKQAVNEKAKLNTKELCLPQLEKYEYSVSTFIDSVFDIFR